MGGLVLATTKYDESLEQRRSIFPGYIPKRSFPNWILTYCSKGVDSVYCHMQLEVFSHSTCNAIRLAGRCFYPKNQAVGGSCEKQERRAMRNVLASSPVCSVEMLRTGRNSGTIGNGFFQMYAI
uniref:Uncharacterized protein n=1 Tax=Grammatophora oceanica TaxID=210454 RepID=A0A6U5LMW5_9STRA|mmetsp:Transcript_34248/g.50835  ORF Transcript_34248/g.50835 Transcript_34248/m.50835 type:complete len:124 (+) Transcript_34248:33-404(+)